MKYLLVLPLLASSALLGGCDRLFGPRIGCADENTIKLVRQIFDEQLQKQLASPLASTDAEAVRKSITVTVDTILADGSDEKLHKYSCRATLNVAVPAAALEKISNPFVLAMLGGGDSVQAGPRGLQAKVTYTSQLTANGKEQYVEMQGHAPLATAVGSLALHGGLAPAAERAAAATSPEPAAEPAPAAQAGAPAEAAAKDAVADCVAEKENAFHAENGADATVSAEQVGEWEEACGSTPRP